MIFLRVSVNTLRAKFYKPCAERLSLWLHYLDFMRRQQDRDEQAE
jgi:hypothetical protein